jgi:hypothetical protein
MISPAAQSTDSVLQQKEHPAGRSLISPVVTARWGISSAPRCTSCIDFHPPSGRRMRRRRGPGLPQQRYRSVARTHTALGVTAGSRFGSLPERRRTPGHHHRGLIYSDSTGSPFFPLLARQSHLHPNLPAPTVSARLRAHRSVALFKKLNVVSVTAVGLPSDPHAAELNAGSPLGCAVIRFVVDFPVGCPVSGFMSRRAGTSTSSQVC